MMRSFVVVVDVQGDFIARDGALPVPGADALVGPIERWLAALPPREIAGVLFTFDTHLPDIYPGSAEAQRFPPHCLCDTPGWGLAIDPDAVDRAVPRYRLEKGVFDMWAEPGLVVEPMDAAGAPPVDRDRFFDGLRADGVERAVVIGVAADFCVRWAVEGLLARGFDVTVPRDLTAGIAQDAAAVAAEIGSDRLVLA